MRVLVLLSLVSCAAAYSSGFASGSAYASAGKASAYASAAKPAAPAPTPAPGPVHRIEAAIKLTGVTLATFDEKTKAGKAARTAFKNTVAAQLAGCGAGGKTFAAALVKEAKKDPDAAATLGAATITVAVTKAPKAVVIAAPTPAPKKVSAAPATAVVSMASVAFAALALW